MVLRLARDLLPQAGNRVVGVTSGNGVVTGRPGAAPFVYLASISVVGETISEGGAGGGGVQRPKNSLCTQNQPPISCPFDKPSFLRKNFLMWLGEWVRRRSPGCHSAPQYL